MQKGMKILLLGIILAIIGFIMFIIGNTMVNNVEAYNVGGLPISDFLRTVSSDINNYYVFGQQMTYAGGIFVFLGIVLVIAGSEIDYFAKQKKPSAPVQKVVQNVPPPQPVVKDMSSKDEAISILRTRYAKGEITKEDYDQKKKDLE